MRPTKKVRRRAWPALRGSFFALTDATMDDLLALMGEAPDGPAAPAAAAPSSTSGIPVADESSHRRQSESSSSNHQTHHVSSEAAAVAKKRRRREQSTLDPLTNLRITNRRTSRFDLSDALAPFEFVTSARLAAMSGLHVDAEDQRIAVGLGRAQLGHPFGRLIILDLAVP